jgi:hypothetical protein
MTSLRPHRRQLIFAVVISNLLDESGGFKAIPTQDGLVR